MDDCMTPTPTPAPSPKPAPPRYRCQACSEFVLPKGRRLQRVNGVRTWVGPCCYRRPA